MNNESDLWNNESYLDNGQSGNNNPNNTSNNQETVYPKFGHYSNEKNYSNYTNYANLLSPAADGSNPLSDDPRIGKCNVSIPALGVPAMVNDFWSNNRGTRPPAAFTPTPDSSLDRKPGPAAIRTCEEELDTTFRGHGRPTHTGSNDEEHDTSRPQRLQSIPARLQGLHPGARATGARPSSSGPPTRDCQRLAAELSSARTTTPSSGTPAATGETPRATTRSTTRTILAWIKNTGPNPFPVAAAIGQHPLLRPDPHRRPASAYTHTKLNSAISDANQRFWKEYIDYVVGVLARPLRQRPAPRATPRELRAGLHLRDDQDQLAPHRHGTALHGSIATTPSGPATASGSAR